jgi:glutamate-5-semialdehyde dehydrogenase
MALLKDEDKSDALNLFADLLWENRSKLIEANQKDLDESKGKIAQSMYDRLRIDEGKIKTLISGLKSLAQMKDPIGNVLLKRELDQGLILEQVSVPLGVIAVIFESRPDVIVQIAGLILKSGNAVVLKGGSEALHTNRMMMTLIHELNRKMTFFPPDWAVLLESRSDVQEILEFDDLIQLVVPRGSNELVRSIKQKTKIPVLGHADGVCHLYVHESADLDKAIQMVIDGKLQYSAACNSIETLLVDKSVAQDLLSKLIQKNQGIEFLTCEQSRSFIPGSKPATEDDWRKEYGDNRLSIKIVNGLDEAIQHINTYGSHHTDGILSTNPARQNEFAQKVDSANVMINSSTRFADGPV